MTEEQLKRAAEIYDERAKLSALRASSYPTESGFIAGELRNKWIDYKLARLKEEAEKL